MPEKSLPNALSYFHSVLLTVFTRLVCDSCRFQGDIGMEELYRQRCNRFES